MVRRDVWNALYLAGGRVEGRMLPAPPWIMRRGVSFRGCLVDILGELLLWCWEWMCESLEIYR